MTRRLYQEDSYIADFTARVVSVEEYEGKTAIELDATCFYPESGGQPGDTGTVGGVRIENTIIDTKGGGATGDAAGPAPDDSGAIPAGGDAAKGRVEDGAAKSARILHIAHASPDFEPGASVEARIDWSKRFINMQQHTGQHILSQAFLSVLDAATISSRLGVEHCTVDVSRRGLTWEDMEKVEKLANSIIYENRPVKIYEISPDEVEGLRRKEPAGLDRIRVVEIEGFDKTPCGGTHTRATGEVGLIKILRWEKVRETTRVEFMCGEVARADYFWKSRFVVELAQDFTAKDTNVPEKVRGLYEEHRRLRYHHEKIRKELAGYRARTLYEAASQDIGGIRVIVAHIEDAEPDEIRQMASLLTVGMAQEGLVGEGACGEGVVALLASGGEKVRFVFARSESVKADMRPLIKAATAIVDGKGGGKPEICEGGGKKVEKAEQALEEAVRLLAESLGG